jgi:HYR domain/Putative Ig domain/Regulator of chromosome condensation (RCC1) repeat
VLEIARAISDTGFITGSGSINGQSHAYLLKPLQRKLDAGYYQTCEVKLDDTLSCWGRDGSGSPMPAPPIGTFQQVSAGMNYNCGLHTDGTLDCWGIAFTTPTGPFIQVSVFENAACALHTDGTPECWGNITTTPTGTFTQIAAGPDHACGVRTDGSITCWGNFFYDFVSSPPPTGPFVQVSAGFSFDCGIHVDGSVECWSGGYQPLSSPQFAPPTGQFQLISVGYEHACGIKDDGTLACWGSDWLGVGDINPPNTGHYLQVAVEGRHGCAVRDDIAVVCWGDNSFGQAPMLAATPSVLLTGISNTLYSQSLSVADTNVHYAGSGGTQGAIYTVLNPQFAVRSGALPPGLTLSPQGVISGTLNSSGSYNFAITASDDNGIEATQSYVLSITAGIVDSTPPFISEVLTPTLPVSGWFNSDVSLYWSVSDLESTVTSQVNCPGAASSILINTDTTVIGTDYTCQATSSGGTTSKTVNVKRDTVPPILSLPTNITVPATSSSGAMVNFTATASDATSGVNPTSVVCSPASGSNFPIGTTTVNCSATDNAINTANGSFTVTVQSTTAPIITCPADLASIDGTTIVLAPPRRPMPLAARLPRPTVTFHHRSRLAIRPLPGLQRMHRITPHPVRSMCSFLRR